MWVGEPLLTRRGCNGRIIVRLFRRIPSSVALIAIYKIGVLFVTQGTFDASRSSPEITWRLRNMLTQKYPTFEISYGVGVKICMGPCLAAS